MTHPPAVRDNALELAASGLNDCEVARRLGVQPPSIYKYFASLDAVYDALFERGMLATVAVMRSAAADAPPGLPALAERSYISPERIKHAMSP